MDVLALQGLGSSPIDSAITIGAFDGVHLGHQALLAELKTQAAKLQLRSVVLTFDRHPAALLRPDRAPKILTNLDAKLELLEATGIDATLVLPFDKTRSEESPADFVDSVLTPLGTKLVLVGSNFHFGKDRAGTTSTLAELGQSRGFSLHPFDLKADEVDPISSTRIRSLIAAASVEDAARLLGRAHRLDGDVVHGAGLGGATLGYPTANLDLGSSAALPADGVYAGRYRHEDGSWSMAAISVGRRPTFYEDAEPLVEAYLLDFTGDLYGSKACLEIHHHLRPELKFEGIEPLKAQMALDVAKTREYMAAR